MKQTFNIKFLNLVLAIFLSGCSFYTDYGLELKHKGTQIEEFMNHFQSFVSNILNTEESSQMCQILIRGDFLHEDNAELIYFLEKFFYSVDRTDIINILHKFIGDPRLMTSDEVETIQSVEIDPVRYETSEFYNFLDDVSQEEIDEVTSILNDLENAWNDCPGSSSDGTLSDDDPPITNEPVPPTSTGGPSADQIASEEILHEMMTFWSENMIAIESTNVCQMRVKAYLSSVQNNNILMFYITDYLFLSDDSLEPDLTGLQSEWNTIKSRWDNCVNDPNRRTALPEPYPSESLEGQAEVLIKEMITFLRDEMVALNRGNSCQQNVKENAILSDEVLPILVSILFPSDRRSREKAITDEFSPLDQFVSDMREKLNTLKTNWNSCP